MLFPADVSVTTVASGDHQRAQIQSQRSGQRIGNDDVVSVSIATRRVVDHQRVGDRLTQEGRVVADSSW